jgi:transcription elongation factor Elf1
VTFTCTCGGKAIVIQTVTFKQITYRRRKCQICGRLLYTATAEQLVNRLPKDVFDSVRIERSAAST